MSRLPVVPPAVASARFQGRGLLIALEFPQFSSFWVGAWFWFTLLIAFIWLKRHVDLNRAGREAVLREDEPGAARDELPPLTVIVAGKDEEANIGRCVEGLLRQDYPRLQVIIVNDRSGDRTGAIIDGFAARDPRMLALHVRELRPGWFGKNNAMREGTERATSDWLCYSDADCTYDSTRLLSSAMRLALREKVDFLSVLPHLETSSLWEKIIQPVAGAVMVFWFPPQRVNDPRCATAYANGAFMLLPRRTYDAIGQHEAVKDTLNEDMHMARRVKQAGLRLRVIRGGDLYRVRMYTGFKQIWRGWSRIFYGCFGTFPRLLASVAVLLIVSLSPYLTVWAGILGGTERAWLSAAGAIAIASQMSIMRRFYRLTGNPGAWFLTYPFGAVLCVAMLMNAMGRLGGRNATTWRGTTYTHGARPADSTSAPNS